MDVLILSLNDHTYAYDPIDIEYKYDHLLDTDNKVNWFEDIVKYEIDTKKIIDDLNYSWIKIDKDRIWNNFILRNFLMKVGIKYDNNIDEMKSAIKKCSSDFILQYSDVHGKDQILLKRNKYFSNYYDIKVVIALYQGTYIGHVYIWKQFSDSKIFEMQGIRISLSNAFDKCLDEQVSGVSYVIVESALDMIKEYKNTIKVLEPYSNMVHVLKKYEFRKSGSNYLKSYDEKYNKIAREYKLYM